MPNYKNKLNTVKPGNFEQKKAFFEGFFHFWATSFWKFKKIQNKFEKIQKKLNQHLDQDQSIQVLNQIFFESWSYCHSLRQKSHNFAGIN